MRHAHLLAFLSASVSMVHAQDWPRFGGPTSTLVASSPDGGFEWPKDGPKVAWRVKIGPGFGGAAVEGGEVFLLDRIEGESDVLRVFELATGKELWSVAYDAPGRLNYKGSRSVPNVVGRKVFTAGGHGHMACFDRDERSLVWLVDMEKALGGRMPMFGWSTQPVMAGDNVIAAPLSDEIGLAALDGRTGKVVWRTESVGYSHSTPAILELGGRPQLLFNACPKRGSGQDAPAPSTLWSFDPATGEFLWKHEMLFARLPVPPPVRIDDERVFVTSGYRAGSKMLRVTKGEAGFVVEEVFSISRGAQTHQPILHEGHLYFAANENWNDRRRREEGGLMCLDLEGNERWRTGAEPFLGRGGFVLAGDVLLSQDGFDGTLRAVRLGPERYDEIASFRPFTDAVGRDGQMWAPPALAEGRLVLRSQEELVCLDLSGE